MEFDFIRDRDGQCSLELNGEQTALERWFNNDARQSVDALDELLKVIADIKQGKKQEYISSDAEFQITLNTEDCQLVANWLLDEQTLENQVDEASHSYTSLEEEHLKMDEENATAACGLDDFVCLLEEWRAFLLENQH